MPRDRVRIGSVDGPAVLDRLTGLTIVRWRYEWESDRTHHIGPSPKEFDEAFRLDADDRLIEPLDASGVAMAAIQALAVRTDALEATLERLSGLDESLRRLEEKLEADRASTPQGRAGPDRRS